MIETFRRRFRRQNLPDMAALPPERPS